jgi:hypothetical protein
MHVQQLVQEAQRDQVVREPVVGAELLDLRQARLVQLPVLALPRAP